MGKIWGTGVLIPVYTHTESGSITPGQRQGCLMPTQVPLSKCLGHLWGVGWIPASQDYEGHMFQEPSLGKCHPRCSFVGAGREGGIGRGSLCGWSSRGDL